MDIYCTRCGEPWDIDELHDVIPTEKIIDALRLELVPIGGATLTFEDARRAFQRFGCEIFTQETCEVPEKKPLRAEATGVLMDLLGDDVDGVAALLDDFEYIGLLD